MKRRLVLAAALGLILGGHALAGEVIVLAGGAEVELRSAPVRQGNNVLLTRVDGTLFSVAASQIDWKATAAARSAPAVKPSPAIVAPAQSPAEAARLSREGPKARVRITDADVDHVAESSPAAAEGQAKESDARQSTARVEIAEYTQDKVGSNLIVRGSARNVGTTSASSLRITVSALDEKQQRIGSADATVSNGVVEPGSPISFVATIPIGDKIPISLRFAPMWTVPPPPAPPGAALGAAAVPSASGSSNANGASSAVASSPPPPAPTPYGRGLYYAPAPPPAASAPPADGKNGYIPGATRKEDQPKPPQ